MIIHLIGRTIETPRRRHNAREHDCAIRMTSEVVKLSIKKPHREIGNRCNVIPAVFRGNLQNRS